MILFCLALLFYIYIGVAIAMLLNFLLRGYVITYTNLKTNEKQQFSEFKKFLACLIMCLIWPIILIRNIFE